MSELKCCSIRKVENYGYGLSQTEARLVRRGGERKSQGEGRRGEGASQPPVVNRTMVFLPKEASNNALGLGSHTASVSPSSFQIHLQRSAPFRVKYMPKM